MNNHSSTALPNGKANNAEYPSPNTLGKQSGKCSEDEYRENSGLKGGSVQNAEEWP